MRTPPSTLLRPRRRSRDRITDVPRKDCHRRGTPSRKRVALTGLGVRLPLLPPSRTDCAPPSARRASPPGARRDARPEAWPSGKAAPCYGVGEPRSLAGSSPAASVSRGGPRPPGGWVSVAPGSVQLRPVAQRMRAVGFEPTRARSSRAGAFHHDHPRVAQLRRAPLLQRGGWGFESLTADTPLKLSSAEQPPCKRTVVGSIPTWGSRSPTPRSPTRQRRPAQTREVRGSNPRGGTRCDVVQSAGRPAVTRGTLVRPQPSQLPFLGRLTAGSSALNRRMRGSNPARGARTRTRHGVHSVSKTEARGFDSFRPCSRSASRPYGVPGASLVSWRGLPSGGRGGRAAITGGAGMAEGSWVGLDVHARKVVAGVLDAGSGEVRSPRVSPAVGRRSRG